MQDVQPKQLKEERFHYQLLDKLPSILFWQGEEKIVARRSAAPGLGGRGVPVTSPLYPPLKRDYSTDYSYANK